ncbi:MAG: hypothetical protein ACM3X6_11505 [Patescibacteria group bacterium]
MKKSVFIMGIFLLYLGICLTSLCSASSNFTVVDNIHDFELEIGETLPANFFEISKSSETVQIGTNKFVQGYNIKAKGIKYKIGVDESMVIIFISTDDRKFTTPEKVKPGMKFMDAMEISTQFPDSKLIIEKGWAGVIPLQSGWNAAVLLDKSDGFSMFDKIAFVFKRK